MDDLNDLYLFSQVVEAGGFSAAERVTGIPKSRLSRRIAALEAQLDVRLIQRSAHRFHVTAIGESVYRHARAIANEVGAVRATVSATLSEPSGLIRVSASLLIGEMMLAGWLADFANLHPKVRVALDLSNKYVDLLAERIDLAIRFSSKPLASADIVARPLGTSRMVLVASPALLAAHGVPADIGELNAWPALAQGSLEAIRPWAFQGDDGQTVLHYPQPRFVTDNLQALREAAIRGTGLIQLPLHACSEALANGQLSILLPQREPPVTTVYAIYPSRHGMPSAVRALVTFLEERFGALG
ncbi:LysR substrate-binding domain-containing protein [Paraherbaspirillum soli]|uniref:LysR substrate-binding domain-containing protein n=1 Tax=Paraherbaspirillum soli TaxID=631222 RepID=A0ABW0M4J8_9BURK